MTYDIHAVLEHYGWDLPAPRTGWVTVKCGAHEDSHQSCRINSDDGYLICMACGFPRDGKAGDSIDVIRHYEGTNFRDSQSRAEELTRTGGRELPQSGRSGRAIPGGSRGNGRNRKYVPPRLRNRAV